MPYGFGATSGAVAYSFSSGDDAMTHIFNTFYCACANSGSTMSDGSNALDGASADIGNGTPISLRSLSRRDRCDRSLSSRRMMPNRLPGRKGSRLGWSSVRIQHFVGHHIDRLLLFLGFLYFTTGFRQFRSQLLCAQRCRKAQRQCQTQ
jgi:hypothetical protein